MKKTIISIFIIIWLLIWLFSNAFASESWYSTVRTTEKIPWVNCEPVAIEENWETKTIPNLYNCEVPKWAHWVIWMLWSMIKYMTYIALLSWVMFIVYNGILYSMWWADQSLKEESKKRIIGTLLWLILLLLSWPILNFIAPWIYVK
jgi:hypothetical protein